VESEEGLVRLVLSFIDESPLREAYNRGHGRRVETPHGPKVEIELPCPVERFTLEIRRDGPLAWEKTESFERTVMRTYVSFMPQRRWGRVIGIAVAASAIAAGIAYALLGARRM
jgi:hypothetical protein